MLWNNVPQACLKLKFNMKGFRSLKTSTIHFILMDVDYIDLIQTHLYYLLSSRA